LDKDVDVQVASPSNSRNRSIDVSSIIIALGSAGFFTGLYSVLRTWIGERSNRRIKIITTEAKYDITGYELEQVVGLVREIPTFNANSNAEEPVYIQVNFAEIDMLGK